MPIHSIFVIDKTSENVLYCKYYDIQLLKYNDEIAKFEKKLFENSKRYWERSIKSIQSCDFDDIFCVLQTFGELLIFVCGTEEFDEPLLATVLDTIRDIIIDTLDSKTKPFLRNEFMNPEMYGKFCVSIDDMISQGILEILDIELIRKYSKLKNF